MDRPSDPLASCRCALSTPPSTTKRLQEENAPHIVIRKKLCLLLQDERSVVAIINIWQLPGTVVDLSYEIGPL